MSEGKRDRAVTFIGAVIVAIALLVTILLTVNWIISSQKLSIEKPVILVERATLYNNTVNLVLKNYGKLPARIEKIYIYEPRIGEYFTAQVSTKNITNFEGQTVGNIILPKTIISEGETLNIQLYFNPDKVFLDYIVKGIIVLDKSLASFKITNYTRISTISQELYEGTTLWKGVYIPIGGFKLVGYKQLTEEGTITAWTPPLYIEGSYKFSEIQFYLDPNYAGLYLLKIKATGGKITYVNLLNNTEGEVVIGNGEYLCLRGFIGGYVVKTPESKIYINGYMHAIAKGENCSNIQVSVQDKRIVSHISLLENIDAYTNILGEGLDYDANGIEELILFSHLGGPYINVNVNTDADNYTTGNINAVQADSLIWEYIISHPVSNVDYISVSGKISFYYVNPGGSTQFLYDIGKFTVFSVVLYELKDDEWVISAYKPFFITDEQFTQNWFNVVFPTERSKTYTVGLLFYDNYMAPLDTVLTDFTFALEYIIVELGVVNPRFQTTPPVFIISIPGEPVENIGEDEVGSNNALGNFTDYIVDELNYLGVPGYVIIDSCEDFSNLLINPAEPMVPNKAIVLDLHGSAIDLNTGICNYTLNDILRAITKYNLVWVRTAGPLVDGASWQNSTPTTMEITTYGRRLRASYALITYLNELLFNFSLSSAELRIGNGNYSLKVV
ncbi:MAG: hypothetical protein DRO40_11165, partial [Thermoprotei archaeon]